MTKDKIVHCTVVYLQKNLEKKMILKSLTNYLHEQGCSFIL